MRTNVKHKSNLVTHEGGPAKQIPALAMLRRSVMSCLLFEKEFYEDGVEISTRIADLVAQVPASEVAKIAIDARTNGNLRHVPLYLARLLCKTASGGHVAEETIATVIQRADELAEFVALYMKDGRQPLSAQAKRGLARAFTKFDEYQLQKNDKDAAWRIRDVMFLVKPKPENEERAALYKRIADDTLQVADTWEVALSSGANKKDTFERLLREEKLGYLALLRNLRNMITAGVDDDLIRNAILARKGAKRVLPFRYVAAARAAKQYEAVIDQALCEAITELVPLRGKTVVLVDVSGSMKDKLSSRSDMTRMDAAATLAAIVNAEKLRVFSFSHQIVEVPPRRGMAGVDAVINSQAHGGTLLGEAITALNAQVAMDRLIVVTDEQAHDRVPHPAATYAYMINVASARNGVGYGRWVHIDGFSESVLRFIHEYESNDAR